MTTDHVATAVAHLDAVAATRDVLSDLYDRQRIERGAHAQAVAIKIAEAHQAIGYGLKAANDHALIAQAQALEAIAGHLAAIRPDAEVMA